MTVNVATCVDNIGRELQELFVTQVTVKVLPVRDEIISRKLMSVELIRSISFTVISVGTENLYINVLFIGVSRWCAAFQVNRRCIRASFPRDVMSTIVRLIERSVR